MNDFGRTWERTDTHKSISRQMEVTAIGELLKFQRGLMALSVWLDIEIGGEFIHHSYLLYTTKDELCKNLQAIGYRYNKVTRRWILARGRKSPRRIEDMARLSASTLETSSPWLKRIVYEVKRGLR